MYTNGCSFIKRRLSSSRPNKRVTKLVGVNSLKPIIPSMTGLTIIPNSNPNCVHSLFAGGFASALSSVTNKKAAKVANEQDATSIPEGRIKNLSQRIH